MKRLMNLAVILLVLAVFTSTTFAQEVNTQARKMVKAQTMQDGSQTGVNWVDADGDGICDNYGTENQGSGKGYGIKDGSGSRVRPQDGTGYGKVNGAGSGSGSGSGSGVCDGTGPKGAGARANSK